MFVTRHGSGRTRLFNTSSTTKFLAQEQGGERDGESFVLRTVQDALWSRWPLLAVVHVQLHDPVFAGPTRERLNNEPAREAIRRAVVEAFAKHLEQAPALEALLVRIQQANARLRPPIT